MLRRSFDTETTGRDLKHGCQPFFVTSFNGQCNKYWEWDVDPLTRKPLIPQKDIREIRSEVSSSDELVLQNTKFDVHALDTIEGWDFEWPWERVYDTLLGGHLLASNSPHDLTSMALWIGYDIKPLEELLKQATHAARRLARSKLPTWRIAKEGLPELPSCASETDDGSGTPKGNPWCHDTWLPRAIVRYVSSALRFDLLPPDPRLPTVGRLGERGETHKGGIRIDRRTKWGNPYVIGKDGDRAEVIRKFAEYLWGMPDLLSELPELYGGRLLCHCKPEDCHGDVLRAFCHPWRTVLAEYSNADSEVTYYIAEYQEEEIKRRGLWKIYQERLKVLPVTYKIENRGVTVSSERLDHLEEEYKERSQDSNNVCVNIARQYGYELVLPKNGLNNSLKGFILGEPYEAECGTCGGNNPVSYPAYTDGCPTCKGSGKIVKYNTERALGLTPLKYTKKNNPSMDKDVLQQWMYELPKRSKAQLFIQTLLGKRSLDTALSYMGSYRSFWVDTGIKNSKGEKLWYNLYPSLNPTGTDTLRWSSENPNEQNISKKKNFNLRYIFGPLPGRELWSLDAMNIERRIPAYEADETEIIALFEKPDEPPYYGSEHALIASLIHPKEFKECGDGKVFKEKYDSTLYQWTKNGNFAIQYGAQKEKADSTYKVPGAFDLIKSRFNKQEELNQRCIKFANKHGYVETIPDKNVDPEHGYPLQCFRNERGYIKPTIPLNYHTQGTACWWMMKAMSRVQEFFDGLNKPGRTMSNFEQQWINASKEYNHLNLSIVRELEAQGYFIVMQVHDEMVFDFPKGKGKEPWKTNLPVIEEVQRLMSLGGDDIGIPTPVSRKYHADNWSEGLSV